MPGSGHGTAGVGFRYSLLWRVVHWVLAVFFIVVAVVVVPIAVANGRGEPAAMLGLGAGILAAGVGGAWLAWANRGIVLWIDDHGVRRTAPFGRGFVRWSEVAQIRGGGVWQVKLVPPRGYERGGRRSNRGSFIVGFANLERRNQVPEYVRAYWNAARAWGRGAGPWDRLTR